MQEKLSITDEGVEGSGGRGAVVKVRVGRGVGGGGETDRASLALFAFCVYCH